MFEGAFRPHLLTSRLLIIKHCFYSLHIVGSFNILISNLVGWTHVFVLVVNPLIFGSMTPYYHPVSSNMVGTKNVIVQCFSQLSSGKFHLCLMKPKGKSNFWWYIPFYSMKYHHSLYPQGFQGLESNPGLGWDSIKSVKSPFADPHEKSY
jgi:hypothetical protein